jgi:hypothetical protein
MHVITAYVLLWCCGIVFRHLRWDLSRCEVIQKPQKKQLTFNSVLKVQYNNITHQLIHLNWAENASTGTYGRFIYWFIA